MERQRHITNVLGNSLQVAKNKRRAGRLRCELMFCDFGEILDLSRTGMRVKVKGLSAYSVGQAYSLTIKGPGATFVVGAKVVWVRKTGLFNSGEMGIEFVDIPAEAQRGFSTLVRSIMA